MSAQTSWASEAAAVNRTASLEIQGAKSARDALDNNELCGSGLPGIVGSAALRGVLAMVRIVAPTNATVLIKGETGTGKELIAQAIHNCSERLNGPFVKVNCAAIPAGLLESELFGHERGAYTGAVTRSIGRFERANRGTLFLDEIGDLPLELQPKLLRVMQEREFERLGSAATIHTDVRVICATHRNLVEMINERQFRADLFYRLGVFPLNYHRCGIARGYPFVSSPFCNGLRCSHAQANHGHFGGIHEGSCAAFMPGNVRELQNVIERSVILSTGGVLSGSLPELPHRHRIARSGRRSPCPSPLLDGQISHILQTLQETKGVIGVVTALPSGWAWPDDVDLQNESG